MRLDLRVDETRGVVANLYAIDRAVQTEMRDLSVRYAAHAKDFARQIVPYDTGFMHDHIRTDLSEDRLRWSVGWSRRDFDAEGLPFYPVFQEYGTIFMAPQPTLGPTMAVLGPEHQRDVSEILRAAIERRRGGA